MSEERHRVIVAGIGGSGAVSVGTLVARAGLSKYKYATRLPNYDTKMRGGACECMVTLSNHSIPTPLVYRGDALIILNNSLLESVERAVVPGGFVIMESTGLTSEVERQDIKLIKVPALETAARMGSPLMANMILLGAYVQMTQVFLPRFIESELKHRFGAGESGAAGPEKENVLALNIDAFRWGFESTWVVGEAS
ncbi:2-oxoacid:acceptor oxidoreductase family protein [Chloroflexota bacterium]